MKRAPRSINGVYYKVTSRNYVSFGVGSSVDTLEDAIKTAKDSNDTAVKKGYEAERLLIVKVTWERKWSDADGELSDWRFDSEVTKTEAVAEIGYGNQLIWCKE